MKAFLKKYLDNKKGDEKIIAFFCKKLASCYSPMSLPIVPSPLIDLTSVFGMGTGVAPSLETPARCLGVFVTSKPQKSGCDY